MPQTVRSRMETSLPSCFLFCPTYVCLDLCGIRLR